MGVPVATLQRPQRPAQSGGPHLGTYEEFVPESGEFDSNPTDPVEKQQGCSGELGGGTAAPTASVSCDLKAHRDIGAWTKPRWSRGVLAVVCGMLGAG